MRRTSATHLFAPPWQPVRLAALSCQGCGRSAELHDTVFVQQFGPNGATEICLCLACARKRGWPWLPHQQAATPEPAAL